MSLSEGEITSQDLSPNAGILGTQIADNTIQLRNLTDTIFRIMQKGTSALPAFTTNTAGTHFSLVTIPHGQSFTPLVNIYVAGQFLKFSDVSLIAATYIPLPIFTPNVASYYFLATDGSSYPLSILYAVDSTNIYVEAWSASTTGTITTVNSIPITYYILQSSIS